jgi:hypothetical protein
MDFNRLRLGELIAGAAGVILLIVMFLPWFGLAGLTGGLGGSLADAPGFDVTKNAWDAVSVLAILLLVTALAAIAAAVITGTQQSVALPVAASVIVTALGVLAALLVLYRILNQPGPNALIDVRFGAYLGLIACAAIALGGFMSMQDEGTSFSQAASRLQEDRPGAAGPPAADVPTQPAPPPAPPTAQEPSPPPPPPPST